MRIIDSNSLGNCESLQTGRAGGAQSSSAASRNGSTGKSGTGDVDTVELSGSNSRVAEALRADSASRAQRVQELVAAVQAGTYEPDVYAVSSALVDEAIGGGER
jgi:flagellar biosynthesis anti-sigma factor FlgM